MKGKTIAMAVTGAFILSCGLDGCAAKEKMRQGTSDSEVLTLTEVPEDKLMITLRMGDGMNYKAMEDAIEAQFPNVDIVVCSNSPVAMTAYNRDCEDIVMSADSKFATPNMEDAYIDLSGEAFIQNYYLSILQGGEMDGKLYFLPGPSNIYGIIYNKDMFKEHGWEVPGNLDEFLELCAQIEGEGIRAIQPALYYTDAVSQFFTGFIYSKVLAGAENEAWLSEYRKGGAVMKGHMEPAFDTLDSLLEAGVFRPDDFEVQPLTRSEMMYKEQTCAMILETQAAVEYVKQVAGDDGPEIGIMPFFSGSDEDSDYFLSVPVYSLAVSKALENEGQEEKLKKVKEILTYLSTVEGQKAVLGENSSVISSVKGVEWGKNEFLKDAEATIEKGHVVPHPFFVSYGSSMFTKTLKDGMKAYAEGSITVPELMDQLDRARDEVLQNDVANRVVKIGTASETFSVLQTSCLIGDIFRERAGAQIGLCAANTRRAGNNWKIYKGDIMYSGVNTLDTYLDISFLKKKTGDQTEGKLLKVKMTGENILKTLNSTDIRTESFPNAYFTASGLKIKFAPWAGDGNRYESVTLEDGSQLNPEEVYTVAFWEGAVDQELIESIEAEYEDEVADLLKKWIEDKGGTIQPDNKNFTLVWK